jgi:hypothetical protein
MSSKIIEEKRFYKTCLTIFLSFLIPVMLVVLLFLTVPKLRHAVFLFTLELPGYATNFMLQQYVPIRRFDKALPWLERELSLVNWFAPPRNRLLPGLIQNTKYMVEGAVFPEEFVILRPFLEKFVSSHPNLYHPRIWLARALVNIDPSATFKQLEHATKLSSADAEPFRIAINTALKNQLPEKLKEWCGRYKKSQFGGLDPLKPNILFWGIGLRELALEVISDSGERFFVGNMSLQLNKLSTYEFSLNKGVRIKELYLHLGIVPGISVVIKKLKTYRNGKERMVFDKDLVLTSLSGFHLGNGQLFTASKTGEVISILSPEKGFGEADQFKLAISFERLGLTTPSSCGEKEDL